MSLQSTKGVSMFQLALRRLTLPIKTIKLYAKNFEIHGVNTG